MSVADRRAAYAKVSELIDRAVTISDSYRATTGAHFSEEVRAELCRIADAMQFASMVVDELGESKPATEVVSVDGGNPF